MYKRQVYIRPQNEAYLGLAMRIDSIPGQPHYRVTFSAQLRRMGADVYKRQRRYNEYMQSAGFGEAEDEVEEDVYKRQLPLSARTSTAGRILH